MTIILDIPHFQTEQFLVQEERFLKKNNLVKIIAKNNNQNSDYELDVVFDIAYATTKNFCSTKLYSHPFVYLHLDAFNALKKAVDLANKKNYRIKIWDAYRPYPVQFYMAEKFPEYVKEGYVSFPETGVASHVRGVAVDLTLIDKNDKELDMGTYFDEMSEKSHHNSTPISDEAKANRELLKSIMIESGFQLYENEWWHYNLEISDHQNDKNAHQKYPKIQGIPELVSNEIKEFFAQNLPHIPTAKSIKKKLNQEKYNPKNLSGSKINKSYMNSSFSTNYRKNSGSARSR